jgi:hypothetical protein
MFGDGSASWGGGFAEHADFPAGREWAVMFGGGLFDRGAPHLGLAHRKLLEVHIPPAVGGAARPLMDTRPWAAEPAGGDCAPRSTPVAHTTTTRHTRARATRLKTHVDSIRAMAHRNLTG